MKYRADDAFAKVAAYSDTAYRVQHPFDGDVFFDTWQEAYARLCTRIQRELDQARKAFASAERALKKVSQMQDPTCAKENRK